jgi:hypothetical protein
MGTRDQGQGIGCATGRSCKKQRGEGEMGGHGEMDEIESGKRRNGETAR